MRQTQLITPSAKAHERAAGRWQKDLYAESASDLMAYYIKLITGSPIPALLTVFSISIFLFPQLSTMIGWAIGGLSLIYIIFDRLASSREFASFRIGPDLAALGLVLSVGLSLAYQDSAEVYLPTLASLQWLLLTYLLAFAWSLFPGINRRLYLTVFAAAIATLLAGIQHFAGDPFGVALAFSPVKDRALYVAQSLLDSPQAFGTLLVMIAPWTAAVAVWPEKTRIERWRKIFSLGLTIAFAFGVLWTYQTGLWIALFAGIAVSILMVRSRVLPFLLAMSLALVAAAFLTWGEPRQALEEIANVERQQSSQLRANLKNLNESWKQSPWVGHAVNPKNQTKLESGNIYFLWLERFGLVGAVVFLIFVLNLLLSTYQLLQEIPETHDWHRAFATGMLGSQVGFHVAGLYWHTLEHSTVTALLALQLSILGYVWSRYGQGLVSDDRAL